MVNAKAFCELLEELYPDQTGLDDEMGFWMFLQDYKKKSGKSKREPTEYLTRSAESDRLSEDLKKRGFKFVGMHLDPLFFCCFLRKSARGHVLTNVFSIALALGYRLDNHVRVLASRRN